MKKVIITADSTCDLTEELKARYGIITTPLHINFGDKSYDDSVNIHPDELYDIFRKSGKLPKTAAISVGEYIDFFTPLIDDGAEVVHINLGSAISATHNNCKLAAEELNGVYAVDSCNLSTGTGLLVIEAAKLAMDGKSGKEIAEAIRGMTKKSHASFILDRLDFMHAGGRCSAVTVLGANLLKLKPLIEVNNSDGSMGVGKKYRGTLKGVVLQYIDEELLKYDNIKTDIGFITHSGMPDELEKVAANYVREKGIFKEVVITRASCTISSHCGPGTLGILFLTK